MDKSEPTPTPWKVQKDGEYSILYVVAGRHIVATMNMETRTARHDGCGGSPQRNAELIVRAVNAHDDLYRELRHLVRLLEPVEDTLNVLGLATLNGARAALAKAEGR